MTQNYVRVIGKLVGAGFGSREQHIVHQGAQDAAVEADQGDGGRAALLRCLDGSQKIGRAAAGGYRYQQVPRLREVLDLPANTDTYLSSFASAVNNAGLSVRLRTRIGARPERFAALPRSLAQCVAVAVLPPFPAR